MLSDSFLLFLVAFKILDYDMDNHQIMAVFCSFFMASLYFLIDASSHHSHTEMFQLKQRSFYKMPNTFINPNDILFQNNLTLDRYFLRALTLIPATSFLPNAFSLFKQPLINRSDTHLYFGCIDVSPIRYRDINPTSSAFYFYYNGFFEVTLSSTSNACSKIFPSNLSDVDDYDAEFDLVLDQNNRPTFGIYFLKNVNEGELIKLKPFPMV